MEQCVVQASVEQQLNPEQLAKLAVEVASDKKATDVILLDIRGVSVIADYFVICTGANSRQIRAIASAIDETLSEHGLPAFHHEGAADSGWVLLDYSDVIVHIFSPKERDYYRLERLWSQAKTIVYLQ
jgi:ribosome-associated protein